MSLLDHFRSLGDRLASSGFHAHTEWWDAQVERFYGARAKRFAARVGRGGIKSTTMVDLAIVETLFGPWSVPAGEVHYFALVSQNKSEASQRLRQIAARLRALGVPHDQAGDEIVLRDLPRGFRVFACQVGSVSGFRCFGFCADELAKWTTSDGAANPAPEVVASLRAMTVTHPSAREFFVSSPLGVTDLHYRIIEAGDGPDQVVCTAPTWVANPSITEADTHALEPDDRIWRREYGAQPQATLSSAFDPAAVDRAFRAPEIAEWYRPICVVDASSGRGDAFAWGIAAFGLPPRPNIPQFLLRTVPKKVITARDGIPIVLDSRDETTEVPVLDELGNRIPNPEYAKSQPPVLVFTHIDSFEGRFSGSISGSDIVARIARHCRALNVECVVGDQRESFFLESEFSRHRLRFVPLTWTNQSKIEAVTLLRRRLSEGTIILPSRDRLRRELLNYSERITSTGAITYSARGSGHDDEASLLVTAAHAELERLIPGSPYYLPNYCYTTTGR